MTSGSPKLLVEFAESDDGFIESTTFETLSLLTGQGGDSVTIDRVDELNLNTIEIDVGTGARDTITINGTSHNSITGVDTFTLSDTDDGLQVATTWSGRAGTVNVEIINSVRGQGDKLIINSGDEDADAAESDDGDTINASALTKDLLAIEINAGEGDDVVVGSPFNDRIDTSLGADTVTGGSGLDLFFDNSPSDEIDTLIEQFDDDMGLFNNTFIVGTLLNTTGNKNFEVGKSMSSELTDFGDNWWTQIKHRPGIR